MTFKTQLLTDDSVFHNTDEFAVAVIYDPSGDNISTSGVWVYDKADQHEGADELAVAEQILIKVADVATVTAGDIMTIESGTWEVMFARKVNGGLDWLIETDKR